MLVILRSDSSSLYATKDLPLAIQKFNEYHLDRSIYVIDVRQSLYLKQIFKTLELLGYDWSDKLYHLAYELVNLPGNVTMASREGTVVLFDDLVAEATSRAKQIVEEKNPELADDAKESIALAVALGALKYTMLSRDNTKVVTFDWDAALDFNGQAAPIFNTLTSGQAASCVRRVLRCPKRSLSPLTLKNRGGPDRIDDPAAGRGSEGCRRPAAAGNCQSGI